MAVSPLSIVFLGTSDFAVPALRALSADPRFQVQLVITQPDKPVGRKQVMSAPPVKLVAEELGIEVMQPAKIRDFDPSPEAPDFLVVISYGQLLPQSLLDWPRVAPINVHGSLLPVLRGASPVHHAILQGLETSGVTVQRMVKELDAGPILARKERILDPRETTTTLMQSLAEDGAELLIKTLSKPLTETAQDASGVTHCTKLRKDDGIADPTKMDATTIDRMVRALTPWPGVTIGGNKILETSLEQGTEDMAVPCAHGSTLFVSKIQPPSGRPMTGKAFGLGHKL